MFDNNLKKSLELCNIFVDTHLDTELQEKYIELDKLKAKKGMDAATGHKCNGFRRIN